MRAGAPDNVTVVVADIIDLDSGATPRRSPGSGRQPTADRAPGPSPSPPQRRRQRSPARSPAGPTTTRSPSRRKRRSGRVAGCAASPWPSWRSSSSAGGVCRVRLGPAAVLRGRRGRQRRHLPGRLPGPRADPALQRRGAPSIQTADLPDFYRNRVENTVSTSTLSDAHELVDSLRTEAVRCVSRKAAGGSCGTGVTATTPAPTTSSTTTAPTPTTTPSGVATSAP